ncbi:DUF1592 domain-containing protein [Lignipirellula cremea]|uniref:Planctomycete cytochrome C n=1 Tax=Lignipirellula cremea TaxID=2528010 RepID=A0A518DNK5_9BACT|nr:DUF1592 domain-containing protein [Lignipirellula cremea]QDU93419.1 hypothetical protein Pla8534_11990 [Lignipirellula cremea]
MIASCRLRPEHRKAWAPLWRACCSLPVLLLATVSAASGADFPNHIQPFLNRHCLSCHGAEKAEGSFRVDTLRGDLAEGVDADRWEEVMNRLNLGEMPPPEAKPQPDPKSVDQTVSWIAMNLDQAIAAKAGTGGEVIMRRLNRSEYNNTLRDLLGIEFDGANFFPEDAVAEGFDNIGQALNVSPVLMRSYLAAAEQALDRALWFDPKPELLHELFDDKEQLGYTEDRKLLGTGGFQLHNGHMVVNSYWSRQVLNHRELQIKVSGKYRVKIRAYGIRTGDEKAKLEVVVGQLARQDTIRRMGLFYLPEGGPHEIEAVITLNPGESIKPTWYNGKKHSRGFADARKEGKPYFGPGVVIESIEVEGPLFLHEGWPKRSHRLALGGHPPEDPAQADIPAIIGGFAQRAFRRPPEPADVEPIVALVQEELAQGESFEEAIRVGLKAVLCSPKFLYLYETPDQLDDYMLASRLSYYLWSSMPDEELLELAAAGKLHDPAVFRAQARRLLADPRAVSFTRNFTGQWLDLRKLGEMKPDRNLYSKYNQELEDSMAQETPLFFREVLDHNLPVDQLIDSDFLMLDEVMARHYGIEGVEGGEFRRVPTPPDSHRGGLLAHASVLNVTSNGTTTSPVIRGAWVLERILGLTPPPPPPDVPIVVPDIRGAKTIREQLDKHRSVAACNSCHRKIDPLGFGLENFDVIGQWRTHYQVRRGPSGPGGWMADGALVDAADTLVTGESFTNADELKQVILLKKRTAFHRNLATRVLTYALGRRLEFADRAVVDTLTARLGGADYGLQDLVIDVALTEPFLRP